MSYEKVRSIKIDEKQGKVFFNTASNNVRPLTYSIWGESKIYNDLLKNQGKEAVEIEILKEYESGNLQGGSNKYTKALKVLRYVFGEEYKKFNWRNKPWGNEKKSKEIEDSRKSKEWNNLLKKALDYKFSKEKYIIFKDHHGEKIFGKSCLSCMKWKYNKKDSTKFDFKEEAEDYIFEKYKDVWGVEVLK